MPNNIDNNNFHNFEIILYKTDVIVEWTVMRNILENPQEHLGKGSRNI